MVILKYCKRVLTSISQCKVFCEVTVDPNYLNFKETMSAYYRKQTTAFGTCLTFKIKYFIKHFSSELNYSEHILSVLVQQNAFKKGLEWHVVYSITDSSHCRLTALMDNDKGDWMDELGNSVELVEGMQSPRFIKSHLNWELLPAALNTVKPKV